MGKVAVVTWSIFAAILLFALYSFATLQRPDVRYGDPDAVFPEQGSVMSLPAHNDGGWLYTGRDPGGSQSSPLNQINPQNVGKLKVAWTHHSGDFREGTPYTGTRSEFTPLVVGSNLYYCTPFGRTIELDAVTGKEKWTFDPYAASGNKPALFAGEMQQKHCRGLAYWRDTKAEKGDVCAERVLRSSGDRAIYALDAKTGIPCADFGGDAGHPGYVTHADFNAYGEGPVSASSPPIVVADVVVAAAGARDSFADAADGVVRGFDVRSGTMLWEFNPIPAGKSDQTGAANVWTLLSADPERKMVFLATTSPSPDYYGGTRKFDMPYTGAVVALFAETGKVAWHYQIIRHDVFDYDLPTHPMLVTISKDNRPRDVVIQATKSGTVFVLDRDTGKPVFPIEEYLAPKSRVPNERLSPTQPVPVLPEHFARMELSRNDMFGLTPIDRAWCRSRFDKMRYDGLFTPPDPQESLTFPSSMGGTNWGGVAFDPTTNLLIVKSDNLASTMKIQKASASGDSAPADFMTRDIPGTGLQASGKFFLSPIGIPCVPPPWGTLTAINMSSGKIIWQVPFGQSKRFGITVPSALNWGSPSVGGPITTAGGLVFFGATMDGKFRAIDIRTGREIWQTKLPAPGMAVPATYAVNGKQYIAIAAGGNAFAETKVSDALVVFALDDD